MIGAAAEPGAGGFLAELVRVFRAQEDGGDGRTDFQLLAPLVTARRRGAAAEPQDPADLFWRIELFYAAVGAAIERRSGVPCQPMLKMHHEGYGRLVLVAGRLVVLSRYLRDVEQFGFESLEALAEAGERLVAEGVETIERYPEVAHLGGS